MKLMTALCLSVCAALAASGSEPVGSAPAAPVEKVEDFRLIDQSGRSVALYHDADARAVVLYTHGIGCPIVRRSIPELNRLQASFRDAGVVFYLINANSQDTREDLAEDAQSFDIEIPILKDETQRIVHSLGSKRTAEAVVLDPRAGWRVLYRGPVDDRFDYGSQKEEAQSHYVEEVLRAHLAGEAVAPRTVETKGCLINFLGEEAVSYAKDVAPILQSKCINCHSEGGVGPFAMSSYKKVRGWSDMMRETLRTHRMPPWHADPAYQSFHNSLDLTVEERRTLLAWIEQGAEQGGDADPLADYVVARSSIWSLGAPDHVVQLPEPEKLNADGVFDYRYITVPSGLTEDRWLTAVEVRPTTEEAVHHALIFIMYPRAYRQMQPDPKSGLNGFFASYLPGGNVQPYPAGTAQFVPAGSTFIFQMHYNATGKAETDQTQMGLYFKDGPPVEVLKIRAAAETEFTIPPRARDYATSASYQFKHDVTLLGLSPHMHYRGSRFRFDATFPDERKETLLSVPWYEFDWQPMYYFDKPVAVTAGTRIQCTGAFDNSAFNPRNPNPDETVQFGEQSYEEMFIGYVSFSEPYKADDYVPQDPNPDGWAGYGKPLTAESLAGTNWQAGRRFQLRFEAGGKLIINEGFEGTWALEGQKVHLKTGRRDFDVDVVLDELFIEGRPLQRLIPGQETQTE